jgi:aspartyl-tRNA synthetase
MNHFAFVDLRDRYGITQVIFPKDEADAEVLKRYESARALGREYVIKVKGKVVERSNKNKNRPTGDIEIVAEYLEVLSSASTPPFKIEDTTDAQEDTRMRFRYLDIRRNPIKEALLLRNKVTKHVRDYLGDLDFCEIETPVLIKSTPEGARDFVVPSRMNPGQFYALPQSPQTFKQLLMVGGMDRYFQIVKCFRDEELRADRQPEFTQIDCEMSFVSQDDVLQMFEGMIRHIFKSIVGHEFPPFQRMEYSEAMDRFGIDKPDLRYDMELVELTDLVKGKNFKIFDDAEYVVGMTCKGIGTWSGKKVKELEKKATGQEVGASALVYLQIDAKGTYNCSAKKFFSDEECAKWVETANAKPGGCGPGDLMLIIAGPKLKTQESMGKFRHLMGTELGLRKEGFRALWVVNFPMLEWDEDEERFTAKHHPFTSPWTEDINTMISLDKKDPKLGDVRANAYDMVINGVEVGGGSVRISERSLQEKVFDVLGFSKEEALEQFGFLMGAFEYGAPPHAGLAFGLDRLCTILGNKATIRDFIAFPKNNQGRDTMIESPSTITPAQLAELSINTTVEAEDKKKKEGAGGYPSAS